MFAVDLMLLCGAWAGAGEAPSSGSDPIAAELARAAAGERSAAVVTLSQLAGENLARMVALCTGREQLAPDQPLVHTERALLLDALDAAAPAAVLSAARAEAAQAEGLEPLLDLYEVLARVETAGALELALELHAGLEPELAQQGIVTRALERCLVGVLARDREAARVLAELSTGDDADPFQVSIGLRALGAHGDPAQLSALERVLRASPAHEAEVLAAIGRFEPRAASVEFERAIELARSRVHAGEPEVRAAAATALGRLGDFDAIDALLGLLVDDDPRPRKAARAALERIRGRGFGGDPNLWATWAAGERAWVEGEFEPLVDQLLTADVPEALGALRRLVQHPWHRARVAEACGAALARADRTVAAAAATQLGLLGGPEACSILIESLAERRTEVREAIGRALVSATGVDLPLESEAWRSWAERR